MSGVKSEYIIKYIEHFIDYEREKIFIVMEFWYKIGGNLRTYIDKIKEDKGCIKEDKIWQFVFEISHALNEYHSKHIIHHDVKPEIIFIDSKGHFKLGDFGIAREIKGNNTTTMIGKLYYPAPEVISGESYDEKCDICGFGCVIYVMGTLHHPFKSENAPNLLKRIHDYEKINIKNIDSRYNRILFELVEKMLEKDQVQTLFYC